MVMKFLRRFRKKGMKPADLLRANFAEIKQFEDAVRTRAAAMTTILQLTGWSAKKANEILGSPYYTERRKDDENGRADPKTEDDGPSPEG